MKLFKTIAIIAIATLALASCEKNELNLANQDAEKEYSFDIRNAVSANYFECGAEESTVSVKSNLPFETTINDRFASDWECDPSTRPNFNILCFENYDDDESYTRDIIVYVRPLELSKIKGYGWFNYPVVIRQRGDDGIIALTSDEVNAYNANKAHDWGGAGNQHYVIGTVKSVGTPTSFQGVASNSGYINPMAPDQTAIYNNAGWNLEACDIAVDVDGHTINLKAVFEAPYGLVTEMAGRVKAGDTVEVNITSKGILEGYNGIFVHPLCVRAI